MSVQGLEVGRKGGYNTIMATVQLRWLRIEFSSDWLLIRCTLKLAKLQSHIWWLL